MNSEQEEMFLIATERNLIKRKRYKEFKNFRKNRSAWTKSWLLHIPSLQTLSVDSFYHSLITFQSLHIFSLCFEEIFFKI